MPRATRKAHGTAQWQRPPDVDTYLRCRLTRSFEWIGRSSPRRWNSVSLRAGDGLQSSYRLRGSHLSRICLSRVISSAVIRAVKLRSAMGCMNRGFDTRRARPHKNETLGVLLNRGILTSRWAVRKRTSSPSPLAGSLPSRAKSISTYSAVRIVYLRKRCRRPGASPSGAVHPG